MDLVGCVSCLVSGPRAEEGQRMARHSLGFRDEQEAMVAKQLCVVPVVGSPLHMLPMLTSLAKHLSKMT